MRKPVTTITSLNVPTRFHENNGTTEHGQYRFYQRGGTISLGFRTVVRQFYKRIVKRDHTMRLPTGEWITCRFPITLPPGVCNPWRCRLGERKAA